jgi:diphthamide synthase subunit DPH2
MKICICCSLSFSNEVKRIAKELEEMGYEVLLPNGILLDVMKDPNFDPVAAKTCNGYNAIRDHFDKILESDAVLICNFTKRRIKNYIGANTFLEAGFAYYHEKSIYAYNPLPNQKYIHDEIYSFGVKVLNGDLTKLSIGSF